MEEVPLYGNLHYLQTGRVLQRRGHGPWWVGWGKQEEEQGADLTPVPIPGRLSQDPGPDQQDPGPGGPARVSQQQLNKRGGKGTGLF